MSEQNKRAFRGVWIPKEIWLNTELTWMEKLLITEINSLDNDHGCYASNAYFAEFFQISASRVSQLMTSLREKGYVNVELYREGGSKNIKYRVVNILNEGIKYSKGGYLEYCEGINTKNSNTKKNNTRTKKSTDTSSEKDPESCAAASAEKELFTSVEEAFLSQLEDETQYSYPRERAHIKKLITRVRNKSSPADFLRQAIETFYRLHNGRDKFWKKQPFLPSVLNSSGIWPRVLEEAKTDYVDTGVELWN